MQVSGWLPDLYRMHSLLRGIISEASEQRTHSPVVSTMLPSCCAGTLSQRAEPSRSAFAQS